MSSCNDPKCPLNRQGVPHENHESIKNKPVQNPCNDPRCAMNRMGMKHEVHDGKKINAEKPKEEKTRKEKTSKQTFDDEFRGSATTPLSSITAQSLTKQTFDDEFRGSATDALNELGKQIHGTNTNRLSREDILEERRKRERQSIEQEAREEINKRERLKQENISTKSKIFSRSKSGLPSINQILHSSDHYETFNISQDSTCDEIKSKYKELSKNYNAARGSVNRNLEEQDRLNKTQSKINIAYNELRKKHCG